MKGRILLLIIINIIPTALQDKASKQLHLKHISIKWTWLLACESIHWTNMNVDIEETVKIAPFALISQETQPKYKTVSNEVPWKMFGICRE